MTYEQTMKCDAVRNIEFATAMSEQWDRQTCCSLLTQFGFGTGYDVQPTDWQQYYETDELREFALERVFPNAE